MMNVMGLENMLVIITDAKVSLLAHDFSNPSITKAVNFLLSGACSGSERARVLRYASAPPKEPRTTLR